MKLTSNLNWYDIYYLISTIGLLMADVLLLTILYNLLRLQL